MIIGNVILGMGAGMLRAADFGVDPYQCFVLGIDNLLNKRLYRRGNAVGVGDPRTIYGAGAATYNEPGRSFYASASYTF